MQISFFSIPARGDSGLQEDLNRFPRSHRVLTVHREFVAQGDNSFWALAVECLEGPPPSGPGGSRGGKPRVDYKEVLSPADFALFARLRDWRKSAAEQEAIPVYAVLTNEQLAAVATGRPSTLTQLREVEGIGEAKAARYGAGALDIVMAAGATASAPAHGEGQQEDGQAAPAAENSDEKGR